MISFLSFFFFNDTATTEIYTLSLHDALPISGARGEAYVFARFATFTIGSQAIVIPKGVKYEWTNVREKNYIDGLVFNKLKNLRMLPSDVCADDTFLRRAFLDIVGVLPSRDDYDNFAA